MPFFFFYLVVKIESFESSADSAFVISGPNLCFESFRVLDDKLDNLDKVDKVDSRLGFAALILT